MNKLKTLLSKILGVQELYITPEKTLDDLGADSLDRMEVMMSICEEFGIENITNEEISKANTIQDIFLLIKEKTSGRAEETV